MTSRHSRTGHGPVLFVHPSDELYGADRVLMDMLQSLSDEERQHSEVWLPSDLEHPATPLCVELHRLGVHVEHLQLPVMRRSYQNPRGLFWLSVRMLQLWRRLRRQRFGTVYCTTSAAFLAAPMARMARVPLVVGHVQELWSSSDRLVLGRVARACHRLLAISTPVRARLPEKLSLRTTVVPNSTPEPPAVEPLDGRTGPLRFLIASRWNGWKGHRTLLAAWDLIDEPGILTVLGGPPLSGESVDVPALAGALRHPESVRVVGEVVDPHPYLSEADVIVVPSDNPEPFGLVAIEAFARGRPVVGSAGGGLADIVTDDVDGWLFPIGDASALAARLGGLTREAVTEAGKRARATYEDRFTLERYAAEWSQAAGLDPTARRA
jgi:glycosyltransferase involved in cell wall biosynthesis